MSNVLRAATALLFGAALGGCAAAADPPSESTSTADTTESPAAPELEARAPFSICNPPLTPMTGHWSCGATGVRTGAKTATTAGGYTTNCAHRATVEFSIPACGVPPAAQSDEITITGLEISTLSSQACAAAYLDYTIYGADPATGAWSVAESGRVHGVSSKGTCALEPPTYSPPVLAWSQIRVSAAAYAPSPATARGEISATRGDGLTPVNLFFNASFVQ